MFTPMWMWFCGDGGGCGGGGGGQLNERASKLKLYKKQILWTPKSGASVAKQFFVGTRII